ncbi:hypothetical protein BDM02DRAFT_3108173 [Thelephora ganbajun]|uniref:Uncharacterized protein n=1 Tax=Thelephora ganbajun TaxID=370292 RepID=A0ACB6ZU25_THEGA|nr:hypothetical protein BDM02DRAFT_3108173 [Thelephora ganbajun]
MAFIKDNPPPATIILISGDRDFAYLLSTVRWRKYNVVLISNSFMTHESLTAQASVVYDWQSDVLKARPPPKLPLLRSRREASSSVVFLTTPQESDTSSMSDAHAVGIPEEHITPAIQPLALSPRPVSIATMSTIRPTHAVLPPDVPLVESEATPIPTKAEFPAETTSASVPMTPTSDDWIVADLTSESAIDQSSPKTIDPVDEDGAQSPAFSSPEMIPSEGEGDIPSSPGYLLLIGEESSVGSSVQDLRDMDTSGAIKPVSRACECKICARSPVLLASQTPAQEIIGGHQVQPTPRESSTPLPIASLPTEEVPPPDLSPAHEIPLNILAPTFTPRISRLSWAEVARPTTRADPKHDFKDLVAVLGELSASGNPRPRFSTVFPLLKDRKPDAFETVGATQFRAYLQLAESAGIVSVEQHQDGDGWISLRHQWNTNSNSPSQRTSSQHAESRFRDLIRVLNDLRLAEDPEPRFSTVGPRLLRKNPSIYENAGVTKFRGYVEAAVEAGIVTTRGVKNGDGWLKLCPAYRNPPVHSSTSASTVSTPPARPVNTTFPFAPLIDFLRSKQLTGAQQIPFSDILAHLISTLGYPSLLSLYNSVPGVTSFSQYLDAAITSGVISLVSGTTASRDALIHLRDAKATVGMGPQLPVPINPTISQHSPFEPLISSLTGLWHEGRQEPMLSEIHPLILAQDIMAYGRVGAVTIKDYVMKAAAANLVIYDPLVMPGVSFMASTVRLREPPLQSPNNPSLLAQSNVSTIPLPSLPPPQEITVSPPSVNVTPDSFRDLVAVLAKLRTSTGETESRFSSVVPLLLKKRPNAYASVGVTKFKDYVILAMENGVVRIRGMKQGDGWVSLSDPKPGGLKSASVVSPQSSKSSEEGMVTARSSFASLKGGGVDPKFVDLVEALGEMWKNGDKKPLFSLVAPQLLRDERKKARTLTACGVDKFKAYAELAKEAGIVKIYYERLGEERISLDPTVRMKAGYI